MFHQVFSGGDKNEPVDFSNVYLSVRDTPLGRRIVVNDLTGVNLLFQNRKEESRKTAQFVDRYGESLLIIAAANGFEPIASCLLEEGADVHAEDLGGNTPLLLASERGYSKLVMVLVNYGANIDHQNLKGNTALTMAALHGHSLDVVSYLISKKANLSHRNKTGSTALYASIEGEGLRSVEICKEILNALERENKLQEGLETPTYDLVHPLHAAAGLNRIKHSQLLLDRGANKESRTLDMSTPLMTSVVYDRAPLLAILMKRGCNINVHDNLGRTPLHQAMHAAQIDIIKKLLEAPELDVNATDREGDTPFMVACMGLKLNSIKELLNSSRRADVDVTKGDSQGTIPLFALAKVSARDPIAACHILDMIAPLLHEAKSRTGVDEINRLNMPTQTTALYAAAAGGCHAFVACLLKHGADPNIKTRHGTIPAFIACQNGSEEVVRVLMEGGAREDVAATSTSTTSDGTAAPKVGGIKTDPNFKMPDGSDLMIVSAEKGHARICSLLQKLGAPLDTRTVHGATALWISCQNRFKHDTDDLIKFFLSFGCNPHTSLSDHANAFYLLAEKNTPRSSFELLLRSCNGDKQLAYRMMTNPLRGSRLNALMIAARQGCLETIEYLCNIGYPLNEADSTNLTALDRCVATIASLRAQNNAPPLAGGAPPPPPPNGANAKIAAYEKIERILRNAGAGSVARTTNFQNHKKTIDAKSAEKWETYWKYISMLPPVRSKYNPKNDRIQEALANEDDAVKDDQFGPSKNKRVLQRRLETLHNDDIQELVDKVGSSGTSGGAKKTKKESGRRRGRDE